MPEPKLRPHTAAEHEQELQVGFRCAYTKGAPRWVREIAAELQVDPDGRRVATGALGAYAAWTRRVPDVARPAVLWHERAAA